MRDWTEARQKENANVYPGTAGIQPGYQRVQSVTWNPHDNNAQQTKYKQTSITSSLQNKSSKKGGDVFSVMKLQNKIMRSNSFYIHTLSFSFGVKCPTWSDRYSSCFAAWADSSGITKMSYLDAEGVEGERSLVEKTTWLWLRKDRRCCFGSHKRWW